MKSPYKVTFDQKKGIVVVQVSGKVGHEEHCAARDEALALCQEKGCTKILIDLRTLNTIRSSTTDCFAFGKSLAQVSPRLRFAHVMPVDAKSKQDVRFTSTVVVNRGAASQEFETVAEAVKWLADET